MNSNVNIDFSNLTVWDTGTYKGKINWKENENKFIPFVYNDIEGVFKIVKYDAEKRYVYLEYNSKINKISISNLKKGNIGMLLGLITHEFKLVVGQLFKDNNRNIVITNKKYIDNKKYYQYKCLKCNFDCKDHDHWVLESSILRGSNCSCCSNRIVDKNINSIWKTNNELVEFFNDINDTYTNVIKSSQKVYFKCANCGELKYMSINKFYNRGFNCPKCGDGISFGEKLFYNLLRYLNIDFISQLNKSTFKWCKNYKYDFYFKLNSEQYIVEIDGEQHSKKKFDMSEITIEKQKEIDKEKEYLAIKNGIENFIRIDTSSQNIEVIIKEITNSKLKNIIQFDNIKWGDIISLSNRSLVYEVCYYKYSNKNTTNKSIEETFNISNDMIRKCFKLGNYIFDWFSYNPEEEMAKSQFKKGRVAKNKKRIEIFKDNISLGIFESLHDLDSKSNELFGEHLDFRAISSVINGKKNKYKGYVFREA